MVRCSTDASTMYGAGAIAELGSGLGATISHSVTDGSFVYLGKIMVFVRGTGTALLRQPSRGPRTRGLRGQLGGGFT
jgi:hypothetical protein